MFRSYNVALSACVHRAADINAIVVARPSGMLCSAIEASTRYPTSCASTAKLAQCGGVLRNVFKN